MAALEQLYNTYKGLTIPSFDGDPKNDGQCEAWALTVRTQRDNIPIRYGDAVDWWNNRGSDVNHYDYIPSALGVYPKAGDYVIWGAKVGNKAGHIDLAAHDGNSSGFLGYDSNWLDTPKLATVQHDYSLGILGYVRLKGQQMDYPTNGDLQTITNQCGWQKAAENKTSGAAVAMWTSGTNNPSWGDVHKVWVNLALELYYQGRKDGQNAQPTTSSDAKLQQIKQILGV